MKSLKTKLLSSTSCTLLPPPENILKFWVSKDDWLRKGSVIILEKNAYSIMWIMIIPKVFFSDKSIWSVRSYKLFFFACFWLFGMQTCNVLKTQLFVISHQHNRNKVQVHFPVGVTIISTDYFWTLVILIHQDFWGYFGFMSMWHDVEYARNSCGVMPIIENGTFCWGGINGSW